MTLLAGLIISFLVLVGLAAVIHAVLLIANEDEMADPHGDVVEVPKR